MNANYFCHIYNNLFQPINKDFIPRVELTYILIQQ